MGQAQYDPVRRQYATTQPWTALLLRKIASPALDHDEPGHAVIVGENKVGKSNLLHPLRLVLDPRLLDYERKLRLEDFWDGLPRPLSLQNAITIDEVFHRIENLKEGNDIRACSADQETVYL